jgi:hypothetical protein
MSVCQNLFVGPFAEWLVPEGETRGFPPRNKSGDRLFGNKLSCNVGLGEPETMVMGKKRYHRYCYVPYKNQRNRKGRPMSFGGQPAWPEIQDLLDIDRQAELDQFAKRFSKELKLLAQKFGAEPKLRWGLVCWAS